MQPNLAIRHQDVQFEIPMNCLSSQNQSHIKGIQGLRAEGRLRMLGMLTTGSIYTRLVVHR